MNSYYSGTGKVYRLNRELGRGGEGTVWELSGEPLLVAKIYNESPDGVKAAKLRHMVAMKNVSLEAFAAWPADLLLDTGGELCGFVMRRLNQYVPLHVLYSPMDRKKLFPDKGYNFLAHVARNLATAFHKLHEAGLVVGDVNEGNILINESGLVAFIDCDSFQIRHDHGRYYCEVGVPRYTAPELLRLSSFEQVERTGNTDSFSMAVLIFQLLFLGRHPFAGRNASNEDIDEEKAIRQHLFAYSLRQPQPRLLPPKDAYDLRELPQSIVTLFHEAFETESRPMPHKWIAALEGLLGDMQSCSHSKLHFYPVAAKSCPWCRFREERGILFFLDDDLPQAHPGADLHSFVQGFWIDPVFLKTPASMMPPNTVDGIPPQTSLNSYRRRRNLMLLSLVLTFFVSVAWYWFAPFGILAFLVIRFGNLFPAIRKERQQREDEFAAARTALDNLHGQYPALEHEVTVFNKDLAKYQGMLERYRNLPREFRERKKLLEEDHYRQQLETYLSQFRIAHHLIPGLGPARKQQLADAGILTASDIGRLRSTKVSGIGPAYLQRLEDWRRSVSGGFVYVPDATALQQELIRLNKELTAQKLQMEPLIRNEHKSLSVRRGKADQGVRQYESMFIDLYTRYYQAEADLQALKRAFR